MQQPSFFLSSVLVAGGGAFGSWLRFCTGRIWTRLVGPEMMSAFPFGTLTVNIVGSFCMGLLMGWLSHLPLGSALRQEQQLLLGVGVIGGFTTFSSFALEFVSLSERGEPALGLFYVALSLLAGFGALYGGLSLMRWVS